MEDERKEEGFLRRLEDVPSTVRAGAKPKKAKLTGKTIDSLRTSNEKLARRIEKYNAEYQRLLEIANVINERGEASGEEVLSDVEQFNRQAEKLAKLAVKIIAFEDLGNGSKIALNGVGIKAIKVPNRLTRLLNGFTKAGREKNKMYSETEEQIAKVAQDVISQNGEELTVDITKLEGLSVTTPGTNLENTNLAEAPLVGTLNRNEYLLNSFLRSKEPLEINEEAVLPGGNLSADRALREALFGGKKTPVYSLGGADLFRGLSFEPKKTADDRALREALFGGKKAPVYSLGGDDLFRGLSFEPKKPKDEKPEFKVVDDGRLVEIVNSQPTLFDVAKQIGMTELYTVRSFKEQPKPPFMNEKQVICVYNAKDKSYVDTSSHPRLVNLVNIARMWYGLGGEFTEVERPIFDKLASGQDVDLDALTLTNKQSMNLIYDWVRRQPRGFDQAIAVYEELSGKKFEPPMEVKEEVTVATAVKDDPLAGFDPFAAEPLTDKGEATRVDGSTKPKPNTGTKPKGLVSIFANPDAEAEMGFPVDQPVETVADKFWNGAVPGGAVPGGADSSATDPLADNVLLVVTEERERKLTLLTNALGDNDTAARFIADEINRGKEEGQQLTAERVLADCEDRGVYPLDHALVIFENLAPERQTAILNEITTGTFMQNGAQDDLGHRIGK